MFSSKIQSQLDEVNRWMSDAESKIKNEVVTSRSRMQADLAEVAAIVNDTAKYNDELHSAIRKQAKQISVCRKLVTFQHSPWYLLFFLIISGMQNLRPFHWLNYSTYISLELKDWNLPVIITKQIIY